MDRRNEVIVGVDGSPASDAAVVWAASEARRRGAALVIVHASATPAPTRLLPSALRGAARRQFGRPIVRAARKKAARTESGLRVRTAVIVGSPTQVLSELSRHAALLVVGGADRMGVDPHAPAAAPHRLVAAAHCPIVTVPAQAAPDATVESGRVVVAVDDGYRRESQIAFAFEEASRCDCDVLLVHACTAGRSDTGWTERVLDETARARDLRPWLRLSVDVLDAPFEDAVATACGPSDLLVLGHHRLHVMPAVLGVRVGAALDVAPCPVAVVREASVAHRPVLARTAADPLRRVGMAAGHPRNDHLTNAHKKKGDA